MSTIIIGAGIVGTALAYELACAGEAVSVVERCAGPADETSFANGALITPSMSDPWASPGVPRMILRYLGREDAPFLLRLNAIPMMAGWGLSFLRNCSSGRWLDNTRAVYPLAVYSRDRLDMLARDLAFDFDRTDAGTLRIHSDSASMLQARAALAVYRELGCDICELDRDACVAKEPSLTPVAHTIQGGFYFPGDRSGDCRRFTQQLAAQAAARGAVFRYNVAVTALHVVNQRISGVETCAGRLTADRYVIAAGSYSAALGRQIGLKIPVVPVKGYSTTIDIGGWNQPPSVPIVDNDRKVAVVRLGKRLRIAGTAEFAGFDHRDNAIRSAVLHRHFKALFPQSEGIGAPSYWHGLRPMSPDGRPIIGPTAYANLYLDTGHGPLGWTLGSGSAKALADLMLGRSPDIDLRPFGLQRSS